MPSSSTSSAHSLRRSGLMETLSALKAGPRSLVLILSCPRLSNFLNVSVATGKENGLFTYSISRSSDVFSLIRRPMILHRRPGQKTQAHISARDQSLRRCVPPKCRREPIKFQLGKTRSRSHSNCFREILTDQVNVIVYFFICNINSGKNRNLTVPRGQKAAAE